MPNTSEARRCAGSIAESRDECGGADLPVSPFYAPRYHFGMLLGVDDFETEQAYHRGKVRLHNAWLHREGVVWGFGVDAPDVEGGSTALRGELRVAPGLALDAVGRELQLLEPMCLSVPAWYADHRTDPELVAVATTDEAGSIAFPAHVVACYRTCPTRQVPAISEPCAGTGADVAYSRAQETVELLLRPGAAPTPRRPYRRLRALFGLAETELDDDGSPVPDDPAVAAARDAILALDPGQQPAAYLQAFRDFAAFDEIDLRPYSDEGEATLFPAPPDVCVVLADVAVTLAPRDGGGFSLAGAVVDNTVRPSHVATSTIQELLCGPLFRAAAASGGGGGGGGGEGDDGGGDTGGGGTDTGGGTTDTGGEGVVRTDAGAPDAGGPRIDPASVRLEGEAVTMTAAGPLSRASVAPDGFVVSAYDKRDGWHAVEIRRAVLDRRGTAIRLELDTGFEGNLVRVIARGTGPTPLLGTNLVPLAGAVGGPPGNTEDGHDFVLMLKRSET